DTDAAAEGHTPGVRLTAPGEHGQKARLAVAVAADDADAVALVDAERDAVEDDLGRILQVQGLSPEKMCHLLQARRTGGPGRPWAAGCDSGIIVTAHVERQDQPACTAPLRRTRRDLPREAVVRLAAPPFPRLGPPP